MNETEKKNPQEIIGEAEFIDVVVIPRWKIWLKRVSPLVAILIVLAVGILLGSAFSNKNDDTKPDDVVSSNDDNTENGNESEVVKTPLLMSDIYVSDNGDEGQLVFGNTDIKRNQIATITFKNTLKNCPDDAWDVSEKKDGAVKAWVTENGDLYDLYIAGEGKIIAPVDCRHLFCLYTNVTKIDFGEGLDTSKAENMSAMFDQCFKLEKLDVSDFDTSNVTNMSFMFSQCSALEELDVSNFDTSKVSSMKSMFQVCKNVTELDIRDFDTSNVTDMAFMFYQCGKLIELDVSNFDTSKVTAMNSMFSYCDKLVELDVSNFVTSAITDASHMFYNCSILQNVGKPLLVFPTGTTVTDMYTETKVDTHKSLLMSDPYVSDLGDEGQIVFGNSSLKRSQISTITFKNTLLDVPSSAWDVSANNDGSVKAWVIGNGNLYDLYIAGEGGIMAPKDSSYLFCRYSNVTAIDFNGVFDTSQVENMYCMFSFCNQLRDLDVKAFDTSKVTNMGFMFDACTNLQKVDVSGFNTSNVTHMGAMFQLCGKLKEVDVSRFDTSKVTDIGYMFFKCSALQSIGEPMIKIPEGIKSDYIFTGTKWE